MKTSKHTPGPWFLPDGDANAVLCGDPQDPQIVAMLEGDDVMFVNDERQMVANAKLIATAPELLAELESIEAQAEETAEGRCFGDPHALRIELKVIAAKARAAIAKATQS